MGEKGLSHRQLMDLSSLSWSDCVLPTSQVWLLNLHKPIKRAKLIMKAENRYLFIMVPGKRSKDPTSCSQIYFQGPEIRLGFKPQVLTRFVVPTHQAGFGSSLIVVGDNCWLPPGCKCHYHTFRTVLPGQSCGLGLYSWGGLPIVFSLSSLHYYFTFPYCERESSPQGRGSQVSCCFTHPGSVSKVCGVLNPKVLHLSYERQPRVMAAAHFDLGHCYKAPANNSKGGFPSLA